jgi:hypothetical protein
MPKLLFFLQLKNRIMENNNIAEEPAVPYKQPFYF